MIRVMTPDPNRLWALKKKMDFGFRLSPAAQQEFREILLELLQIYRLAGNEVEVSRLRRIQRNYPNGVKKRSCQKQLRWVVPFVEEPQKMPRDIL